MNVPPPPYNARCLYNNHQTNIIDLNRQFRNGEINKWQYESMLKDIESAYRVKKQIIEGRDKDIKQKELLQKIINNNKDVFTPFKYGLPRFFPPSRI